MPSVDIIVPVYNEQDVLSVFQERINGVMSQLDIDWRVLFVDDGSSDGSLQQMKQLQENDSRYGYLSLSRNFGKEQALTAGLDHADGDAVIVIDVDLQDPPGTYP
jgi:Glycosyltransferases involved in cell wall biogenesis